MSNCRFRRGYMLLELILYLTIVGVLMPSFVSFILSMKGAISSLQKQFLLGAERLYIHRLLFQDIGSADTALPVEAGLQLLTSDGRDLYYDCYNSKVRRRLGRSTVYLSQYTRIESCEFKILGEGRVHIQLRLDGQDDINWWFRRGSFLVSVVICFMLLSLALMSVQVALRYRQSSLRGLLELCSGG